MDIFKQTALQFIISGVTSQTRVKRRRVTGKRVSPRFPVWKGGVSARPQWWNVLFGCKNLGYSFPGRAQSKRGPNCFLDPRCPPNKEAPLCINSTALTTFFSPQPFLGQDWTPGSLQKYPPFQRGCFLPPLWAHLYCFQRLRKSTRVLWLLTAKG